MSFQTYSTDPYRGRSKLAFWHNAVCRSYAVCEGMPEDKQNFSASFTAGTFGPAEVTQVRSDPISYERQSRHQRRDGRDDIFLALMVDGECRFEQNDRRVIQRPGDVLLYDTARSYRFDYRNEYAAVLVRLPRTLLAARVADLDHLGGSVISGKQACGRLLGSVLENAYDVCEDETATRSLMPSMIELLASGVAAGLGKSALALPSDDDQLARIKGYLLARLADDTLTLDLIAASFSMSVRTLCRLFARDGETPMGWLQQSRLTAAHAALIEGRARSVTDVAFDFGFKDVSNFGRAFKRKFGVTPMQVMRRRH